MIETAESEAPMPGPTTQRNQSRFGGGHPQARKTSVARITYIYTKMGLNGKSLQAQSSMNIAMPTLNHDDVSKNPVWHLPKIAKEILQNSKQKLSAIRICPAHKKGVRMSSIPPPSY